MLLRYGGRAKLTIESAPGKGTVVRITIPVEISERVRKYE
jgi:sensor histidine kinase YesM